MNSDTRALLRAGSVWGLPIGLALVVRYGFDTFRPVADLTLRASILSYLLLAIFLLAAMRQAWLTGRVRAALLVAVSAGVVGSVVSAIGAGILLAIWHDPDTMQAWRVSGGLAEVFVSMPFDLFCIGIILGTVGGMGGKYMRMPFKRRP